MSLLSSNFARWTVGFMLAGLVALLAIVSISIWLASRTSEHAEEARRTREIRTVSTRILTLLLDAETSQRGFLLTEAPEYLQPYEQARPRLQADLARMRALVADDPEVSRAVGRATEVIEGKLAELAQTIALVQSGQRAQALDIVTSDRGKELMDQARQQLDSLIRRAESRVQDRLRDLDNAAYLLIWTTAAGGALIVLFGAGAFWTVLRYTRELVRTRTELEVLNMDLEQRVAERTSALTRANDEIQRFAYIVSHDLRAPLVNIMGFTSELEVGMATLQQFVSAENPPPELVDAARTAATEDLPEAVRFIRASTNKMDGLINAILKLSREGRRELRPEPVELGKLLTAAANSVQHQVEAAGARIELPAKCPKIISDRLALEQVFGNLIDNAVKYLSTDRAGHISVQVKETRDRVEITVADNGRGIAPQDHERIFELFRRSGTQDRPGEGIGLSHVRTLVRRLGGEISVRSRLGEGAAFDVNLPKIVRSGNESYSLS